MNKNIIKKFTHEDLILFAKASGDWNPIHTDSIFARRSPYGQTIVHGILLLIWGLENVIDEKQEPIKISKLRAEFLKPVYLEKDLILKIVFNENCTISINIYQENLLKTFFEIAFKEKVPYNKNHNFKYTFDKSNPEEIDLSNFNFSQFKFENKSNLELLFFLFPSISNYLDFRFLSLMLSISRLIGMKIPGLYSLFSELSINEEKNNIKDDNLLLRIEKCDLRFKFLDISIESMGYKSSAKVFIRPKPSKQLPALKMRDSIQSNSKRKNKVALVVGGSRGVGEVMAKILALSGTNVIITYNKGSSDSNKIVTELNSLGIKSECIHLDVIDPVSFGTLNQFKVDELYYFATPPIFHGDKDLFSLTLFESFNKFYVHSLYQIINILIPNGLKLVYSPSSAAIEEIPSDMKEYCLSKYSFELLLDILQRQYPDIKFIKPRLPRMNTDQTLSIFPVNNENTFNYMLNEFNNINNNLFTEISET